jgi:hypothetical protein
MVRCTDYDEAAVIRVIGGERSLTLTRVDRLEVVRRLVRRGLSTGEIAEVVQKDPRQVLRDKVAMLRPAVRPWERQPVALRKPRPAKRVQKGALPTCTGGYCANCMGRIRMYQKRRAVIAA